jgi:hypothetical protein
LGILIGASIAFPPFGIAVLLFWILGGNSAYTRHRMRPPVDFIRDGF